MQNTSVIYATRVREVAAFLNRSRFPAAVSRQVLQSILPGGAAFKEFIQNGPPVRPGGAWEARVEKWANRGENAFERLVNGQPCGDSFIEAGDTCHVGVTPEQDAAYAKAVKAGDTATAQKMVDEAAKKAGGRDMFHASRGEYESRPKPPYYLASDEEYAQNFGGNVKRITVAPKSVFDLTHIKANADDGGLRLKAELESAGVDTTSLAFFKEDELAQALNRNLKAISERLKAKGFDGVDLNEYVEGGGRDQTHLVLKDSADPITRDAQGNVIPLSQRFDKASNKISNRDDMVTATVLGQSVTVAAEPTEAQKESGSYKKGEAAWNGLSISVENLKGGVRSGTNSEGATWATVMPASYGYIVGSEGADGDEVDVYIGDAPDSSKVFVIDQMDAETGEFDEHKAMLAFPNLFTALSTYHKGFSDGRGAERVGDVTPMTVEDFKVWLKSEETKEPVSEVLENSGCGTGSGGFQPGNTCARVGLDKDVTATNLDSIRDTGPLGFSTGWLSPDGKAILSHNEGHEYSGNKVLKSVHGIEIERSESQSDSERDRAMNETYSEMFRLGYARVVGTYHTIYVSGPNLNSSQKDSLLMLSVRRGTSLIRDAGSVPRKLYSPPTEELDNDAPWIEDDALSNKPCGASFISDEKICREGDFSHAEGKQLVTKLKTTGGFTYEPAQNKSPKSGFAVSAYKHLEVVLNAKQLSVKAVKGFYDRAAETLKKDPLAHMGGWFDKVSGKIFLDVVQIHKAVGGAMEQAKQLKELAIFDLGKMAEIRLQNAAPGGRVSFIFPRGVSAEEMHEQIAKLVKEHSEGTLENKACGKSFIGEEMECHIGETAPTKDAPVAAAAPAAAPKADKAGKTDSADAKPMSTMAASGQIKMVKPKSIEEVGKLLGELKAHVETAKALPDTDKMKELKVLHALQQQQRAIGASRKLSDKIGEYLGAQPEAAKTAESPKSPEAAVKSAEEKTVKPTAEEDAGKAAVTALKGGGDVVLKSVKEVNTAIEEIHKFANEAKKSGEKVNLNLCKVSVPGTNLFCGESLKGDDGKPIPRSEMPQLAGFPVKGSTVDDEKNFPKDKAGEVNVGEAFVQSLLKKGVKTEDLDQPASSLKASQSELKGSNVAFMMSPEGQKAVGLDENSIFVSRDGYVIDGHHRWAAKIGLDAKDGKFGDTKIKTRRIDMDIKDVLKAANKFTKEIGIAPKKLANAGNCGTGDGGFKAGNTCATGSGEEGAAGPVEVENANEMPESLRPLVNRALSMFPTLGKYGSRVVYAGGINLDGEDLLGSYEIKNNTVKFTKNVAALAHECGHAELDGALTIATRELGVLARKAVSDGRPVLDSNESGGAPMDYGYWAHKPIGKLAILQPALREFVEVMDKGRGAHPSNYSKSFKDSYIVSAPEEERYPVKRKKTPGDVDAHRGYGTVTRKVYLHVHEAYAEFMRGILHKEIPEVEGLPSSQGRESNLVAKSFDKMGSKESRAAFLKLRKAIHELYD